MSSLPHGPIGEKCWLMTQHCPLKIKTCSFRNNTEFKWTCANKNKAVENMNFIENNMFLLKISLCIFFVVCRPNRSDIKVHIPPPPSKKVMEEKPSM